MMQLLVVMCLCPSLALAQLAIDTQPGVTSYDYGHTRSVESIPGVTHFSRAVEGTVIEIAPGIRSYHLHRNHPSGVPLDLYQRSRESTRNFEALADALARDRAEQTRKTDEWRRNRGR